MDVIQEIVRVLHSWNRWLVLIFAVVGLVYFGMGLVQRRGWEARAQSLLNGFGNVIGLQWLLGLILLGVWGSMTDFGQRHFYEHLFAQTLAMIAANAHHGWRRRELPDSARWRNGLLVIIGTLVLVVIGVLALPGGIQWRFYIPAGS
jgi:hypothetical protein